MPAMSAIETKLLEKLGRLQPEKLAEVEDFVDFLARKSQRQVAFDRLLAIAPAMEAAGIEPMSEADVAAQVMAVRAERDAQGLDEPPRVRLVLDTNVVFSALLWRGTAYRLFSAIRHSPDVELFS